MSIVVQAQTSYMFLGKPSRIHRLDMYTTIQFIKAITELSQKTERLGIEKQGTSVSQAS